MGNYKFKLSHMLPNAWFYKLKDMTRIRKTTPKYITPFSLGAPNNLSRIQVQQPHLLDQRKSYYITRDLIKIHPNATTTKREFTKKDIIKSPRKSSPRKRKSIKRRFLPNRLVTSVSASCNCHTTLKSRNKSELGRTSENVTILPESHNPVNVPETFDGMVSWSTSCQCRIENDVIYDKTFYELNNLPPINTKKHTPENYSRTKKRFSGNSSSPGVRLRTNSPKIVNRRIQNGRKSMYSGSGQESLAVVKMSIDPRKDFMESMVEMIVENDITAAKQFEELLVCYLLLNSDEYHGIIINVFKQIWSDFVSVQHN